MLENLFFKKGYNQLFELVLFKNNKRLHFINVSMCVTCDISNKIVSNKIFQLNPEKK